MACPRVSYSSATPTDPELDHCDFNTISGRQRVNKGLTCAGIVIDPDVACMADAHEGAGGVNTHGVLSAVVLPLSTLVDI